MKKTILSATIIALIAVSNYYSGYIRLYVDGLNPLYKFENESGDFRFTAIPAKGLNVKVMENSYNMYLKENPDKKNEKIYRTFRSNTLKFWNWYYYSVSDLYKYEYKNCVQLFRGLDGQVLLSITNWLSFLNY